MESEKRIPLYRNDARPGDIARKYSPATIEHWLKLSLVVVKRNRKGQIVCAHNRPKNGLHPLLRSAHSGTHYSHEETRKGSHKSWAHRRLLKPEDVALLIGLPIEAASDAERFNRAVFLSVVISCL